MGDIRVGSEILAQGGRYSRVVALLHENKEVETRYLHLRHSCGALIISPQHLLRLGVRRRDGSGNEDVVWSWAPAQEVRVGDCLLDGHGSELSVYGVETVDRTGAYAPLTLDGSVIVNGALCSCYAPPGDGRLLTHSVCHSAMLPLRLFEELRVALEQWSQPSGSEKPLLTMEPLWLLPSASDISMHPYAGGLLEVITQVDAWFQCGWNIAPSKDNAKQLHARGPAVVDGRRPFSFDCGWKIAPMIDDVKQLDAALRIDVAGVGRTLGGRHSLDDPLPVDVELGARKMDVSGGGRPVSLDHLLYFETTSANASGVHDKNEEEE